MKLMMMLLILSLVGCSSFKAKRVGAKESDEKAMEITDNWVSEDTRLAVKDILNQMYNHKGLKRYMANNEGTPKIFIAEVQNNTSEAYFPIDDLNDELLNEISSRGDFILVDAKGRKKILEEVTYQNDGMVDPTTAKQIGRQLGADLLIFGNVYMKPEKRKGQTIKEYSVNIRVTDIEKGVEVLRTRKKIFKYSDQNSYSW